MRLLQSVNELRSINSEILKSSDQVWEQQADIIQQYSLKSLKVKMLSFQLNDQPMSLFFCNEEGVQHRFNFHLNLLSWHYFLSTSFPQYFHDSSRTQFSITFDKFWIDLINFHLTPDDIHQRLIYFELVLLHQLTHITHITGLVSTMPLELLYTRLSLTYFLCEEYCDPSSGT